MTDTLDVLTLAQARAATGIESTDTSFDTDLQQYVTSVSRKMDGLIGPVVQRTITGELLDGGSNYVIPAYRPVASFTTVTEYQGTTAVTLTAETPGVAPANAYLWDARLGRLRRRESGTDACWYLQRSTVSLTYVAGWYANTAAVDPQVVTAAQIILAHLWRAEKGSGNATFGDDVVFPSGFAIPRRAVEMLGSKIPGPVVA
jgi:hypothetical protein